MNKANYGKDALFLSDLCCSATVIIFKTCFKLILHL